MFEVIRRLEESGGIPQGGLFEVQVSISRVVINVTVLLIFVGFIGCTVLLPS